MARIKYKYMNILNQHLYQSDKPYHAPEWLHNLLALGGIFINGDNPWDMQIHDQKAIDMLIHQGSLGLGEAYMAGYWDCDALDVFFYRAMSNNLDKKLASHLKIRDILQIARHRLLNLQSYSRAYEVGTKHYDIGNDVFETMLDPTMSYSCGYWRNATNLNTAQQNKLDLICKKLELQPGEKLLDIGCGWGGLARHAAENYGVAVDGITISKEQVEYARSICKGMPVNIQLQDYRDLKGQYEKIVSVGMFEHVGFKNYDTFFSSVDNLLVDDGLFLLHTIGANNSSFKNEPWVDKYIFPNGYLPSLNQVTHSTEQYFIVDDLHNFGPDYDKTLLAWWQRFSSGWDKLSNNYNQTFYRMWKYYLHCFAGVFRSRRSQLWQIVLSKPSREQQYHSIR